VGFGVLRQAAPGAQAQPGVYTTQLGDRERIKLADGSVVTLNTASRIEARITASERSVRLLQGEAYFEVAKDPSRPFRVYAADSVTQAVGTAFSVQLSENGQGVEVVVSEGKVQYSRVTATPEPVAFVTAGQSATFDNGVVIEPLKIEEIERKLSWRSGRLVFAGDPLSSVVADISRYTGVEFEFADTSLAEMRVGGTFDVGRVEDMLTSLETNFGVEVERVDDTHVRIARKAR
jgi:transmembrane sensor